ncbi:hypothetical protein HDU98_007686 [Podochytrium sp. JEL0797]|nr:hypothetical protein HDU98_007686 [Podochytrium sp. JEL0797]
MASTEETLALAHQHMASLFSEASLDAGAHSRLAKEVLAMDLSSSKAGAVAVATKEWRRVVWRCVLCVCATKKVAKDAAAKSLRFVETLARKDQSLVLFLLKRLVNGSLAKQSHVRFRVCQLLFVLLNLVHEIDDTLHESLKTVLIMRARDKDQHVRVQASLALTRFQGPAEDVDEQVVAVLIDLMTGDPCADVRKTLLWNIDLSSQSLIPLLQRANDVDVGVRRMLYQKISACVHDMLDLPREVRTALLAVGLKDRDAGVRKKCKSMLCDVWWKAQSWNAISFLKELDVRTVAAEEALVALISANLITVDFMTEDMWDEHLTLEFIFFANIYARCLYEKKSEDQLQDFLPSLTHVSVLLQRFGNLIANPPPEMEESELKAIEFVLSRVLQMTQWCEFAMDEAGRRGVEACLSKLMVLEDLPTENLQHIIKILQKMSVKEADVILVVADAVSGILEASEDAVLDDEMDPMMHKLLVQMQCLEIIRALLEQMQRHPYKDTSFLMLLHRFIIPSVRNDNALLRQTGIQCLGLACYVDRTLALENANLFLHAFQVEENDGKKLVLQVEFFSEVVGCLHLKSATMQILFDLILVHGSAVVDLTAVQAFILACLQHEDPGLLTLAAEGATKLLMMKFIANEQILEAFAGKLQNPKKNKEGAQEDDDALDDSD